MFRKITRNSLGVFLLLAAAFILAGTVKLSAACPVGSNIIVNGDAEADQSANGNGNESDVSAWEPETGEFTIGKYGISGFPNANDPGPANRGNFMFAGGNVASSSGSQIINIADCATQIDAGNLSFSLSGFLGGFSTQDDNARLTVTFRDAANASLGTATIGPVLAADRGNLSGLLSRNTNGTVPVGTRTVEVVLLMTRTAGTYNDGYADNLSLMLTVRTAATVSIGGRVVTAKGGGIGNARVSLTDSQGNTKSALTDSSGYYRFTDIPAGETYILNVSAKRFAFQIPTQILSATDDETEMNFIAYRTDRKFLT